MYRGKDKKLLHEGDKIKAVTVNNRLFIQVNPLFETDVLFVEVEKGTEVVFLHKDKIIDKFIYPFIKPSLILDKGRLIADKDKDYFGRVLEQYMDIEFYNEQKYKSLNAVEKRYYVEKTWDLSHTLVYDLLK